MKYLEKYLKAELSATVSKVVIYGMIGALSQQVLSFLYKVMNSIRDCFVTGKWEEDKDAAKILKIVEVKYCILQEDTLLSISYFSSISLIVKLKMLVNCEMLWASPLLGSAWMHIVSKVEKRRVSWPMEPPY